MATDTQRPPAPGPTRIALDQLWARYRRGWRRLLSRRLVRELELRASFDTDLIAPWRVANQIPKGTLPDCARCEDICCGGYENVVSLRLVDVATLVDLDRTDLMSKKKPNFPPDVLRARPALVDLAGSVLWRTLPVMKQVGSARACAALTSDLKCSLHPHWPTSCERFPYTLSAPRNVVWGTRCPVQRRGAEHEDRSRALFRATLDAYNQRVKDAVLLAHARAELDGIGLGAWLIGPDDDPFEPRSALPVID